MAFVQKTWVDRQSEYPNRRTLTPAGTEGTYDVARAEGLILEEGDAFSAATMNDLESRVAAGYRWLYAATLLVDGWTATGGGGYTQTAPCTPADGGPALTAATQLGGAMTRPTGVKETDEALLEALTIINLGTVRTEAGAVAVTVWELPACDVPVFWYGRA